MNFWSHLRSRFARGSDTAYRSHAAVDLDILDNHDRASKLLVGVDLSRLERLNRNRGGTGHNAVGQLHIDGKAVHWAPDRAERSCGVRDIDLAEGEVRSLDLAGSAATVILQDGTHIPFVVQTQGKHRRRAAPTRSARTEPPLIS